MYNFRKWLPYLLLAVVAISAIAIWHTVYIREHGSNILKVAFLDIGQGDGIYIEAPNGRQMLVDGGPGAIELSRLASVMPFGDRSIDVILATHTDADHIGGFPFVLDHYKVGEVIENGAVNTTHTYTDLQSKIAEHHVGEIVARRGMRVVLDSARNIYFEVLFPDRDISSFDSNDGSIVGRLVYGNESFMLTGDATKYTEYLIMQNEPKERLQSTILKLGHHGSKYSSSELWLDEVQPSLAIISAGLHNRYGHPHQEVLDLLYKLSIPYLGTYKQGTIIFKTDGQTMSHN